MKVRVGINGFGRIGRLVFRRALKFNDIEIVAINDLSNPDTLIHLLKYDSAHGKLEKKVEATPEGFSIEGRNVKILSESDPEKLPWQDMDIDIVLECTGFFTSSEGAGKHLKAGARKVVLSAPAKDDGVKTIVLGVNDSMLHRDDHLLSNASCTTNCLAPLVKVIHDNWGIERGSMTTTHAYTGSQNIVDGLSKDLRRARAAAVNVIPTTTGAARALKNVIPGVGERLITLAFRVPVVTGSLVELNVLTEKETTVNAVNDTFRSYAEKSMAGILRYTEEPLVSTDIISDPHSSILDASLTEVNGRWLRVVSWYDNEFGYSSRLVDMVRKLASL